MLPFSAAEGARNLVWFTRVLAVRGLQMERRKTWILLIPIVVIWWSSRDFVSRRFGTWPCISNADTLVAECDQLVRGMATGRAEGDNPVIEVPSSKWPPSVAALRPRGVFVRRTSVDIYLSSGGIGTSRGYLVFPQHVDPAVLRAYFTTRAYKDRIFFWESQT